MLLPCSDPRDARGLEAGVREIADAVAQPLIIYLKSEDGFGSDKEAGLDAIGRLVDEGVAVAIKYAVVLDDPLHDPVSRRDFSAASIAVTSSAEWESARRSCTCATLRCPGMTTGSGCIAPHLCSGALRAAHTTAIGRALRSCVRRSCRSRICATRGVPRASSITRPSSPESRRAGPIPPYVSALARGGRFRSWRRSRASCGSATHEPPAQDPDVDCEAIAGSARTTFARSATARAPSRPASRSTTSAANR